MLYREHDFSRFACLLSNSFHHLKAYGSRNRDGRGRCVLCRLLLPHQGEEILSVRPPLRKRLLRFGLRHIFDGGILNRLPFLPHRPLRCLFLHLLFFKEKGHQRLNHLGCPFFGHLPDPLFRHEIQRPLLRH